MLKSTLLFAGIFFSFFLGAQITITSSDMPNAKDSILFSTASIESSSDATLTDTNFIWDYAKLRPILQQYDIYDAPSTFKSPYNLLFNPFNTSYGRNNYGFKTVALPGVKIDAAYDFFKESERDYRQIGSGYIVNGAPLPFFYSKHDIIYRFPMKYLNQDSCDFKFGLPIPQMGYYGQSGHRKNLVDGWGTLITPFGTYTTIRVRSTITTTDTIYIEALKAGSNIKRPVRREYKWFAVGSKIPVLQIDGILSNDSIFSVLNVQFLDSLRKNVPHLGIANISKESGKFDVYPNPANDQFTLHYTLKSIASVAISMTDISGKIIYTFQEAQSAGEHRVNLNTLAISNGIYFLKLQCNQAFSVQKIVIAK